MRWDYAEPDPQVFVADGETLWVYQPNEAQAFKQPLKSAQLPVALTFMSGKGELRDEFEASLVRQQTIHLIRIEFGSYQRRVRLITKL